VCPWHGYAFDVQTGMTDFGLPVSNDEALTFALDTQCIAQLHRAQWPVNKRRRKTAIFISSELSFMAQQSSSRQA